MFICSHTNNIAEAKKNRKVRLTDSSMEISTEFSGFAGVFMDCLVFWGFLRIFRDFSG
jgi:hypothetical protein